MKPVIFPNAAKAAIFDMDGTMVRNMIYHKKAWQEYLKRHGMQLSEHAFRQKVSGRKNNQIFELLFRRKLNARELKRYSDEKEALYRELYRPHIEEVEGLTALVEKLHAKNIQTAIGTTAPAKNREFVLQSLGLEGRFAVILGDEDVTHGKPHPEIYLSVAKALAIPPKQCVVFEDSPPGIEAGKNAGMVVIGLTTSHGADELAGADYMVHDFRDITV